MCVVSIFLVMCYLLQTAEIQTKAVHKIKQVIMTAFLSFFMQMLPIYIRRHLDGCILHDFKSHLLFLVQHVDTERQNTTAKSRVLGKKKKRTLGINMTSFAFMM